ncbi:MAG: diguanylate cyclase [Armatimonadota bacterium]|nr:diguanylate cyclase [Armatimonadota bacterium]
MTVVLIAEDDAEISHLMTLTLRMEDYDILQARDGAEALQLIEERLPDLVLMDVLMPGMTGHQVAQALRAKEATANIPIIFVTAQHDMEDRVMGLELGVDYICKPFAVPELLARVRSALRMKNLQEELRITNEQLKRLAVTDELTGLSNRRGFQAQLEDELWRARRFGHPIAVLMFDLDHFKKVNDTYGHPQGDVVLKSFAEVLLHSSRRIDKVARYGGEEFAAVLPETDESGAITFAEKVRAATAALEIPRSSPNGDNGPPIRITVSCGDAVVSAILQSDADVSVLASQLMEVADRCLYQAKAAGRNQVVAETVDDLGLG